MTEINAERINLLFERINLILGNGAGQNGYGQGQGAGYGSEIASYPVSNTIGGNAPITISAADVNSLFTDMVRCRIHQIGTEPTEIAEIVKDLNIVGLNSSFFVDDQGTVTTDPEGDKKGIVDYENLMTQIEADKFLAHPSQMSIEPGITSFRTTRWNGVIQHEFTVSFRNDNHRRHFFNTGGDIRISTALTYTGPEAKTKDWQIMLSNIGTVRFTYNSTSSTGSGDSAASIGNYQLTSLYQRIFTKLRGGGVYSPQNVYSDNSYSIDVRAVDDRQIRFKVSFADDNVGRIDEDVKGQLESNVRIFRATGIASGVRVPAPTFFNNISLG
jgi:hypothetical protein